MVTTIPIFRTIAAKLLPSRGYGRCHRCAMPWWATRFHSTPYKQHENGGTHGLFPLCERCWRQLAPQDRLPYYDHLVFNLWPADSWCDWPLIKDAVLNEKTTETQW